MTGEQIVQVVKFLGLEYTNLSEKDLKEEIENRLVALQKWMLPSKDTMLDEDFIIPKEIVNVYVGLTRLSESFNKVVNVF